MTEVPDFRVAQTPPYVRAGDTVLWFGKPTLRSVFSVLLGMAFSLFFFLVVGGFAVQRGPVLSGLVGLFFLFFGVIAITQVLRIRKTEYVITRTGIYARMGIIGTTIAQTTFDKITDLEVRQDVLGRLLGYGSLQVNTAGSAQAPILMAGLVDALQVKTLVEQAKAERSSGETQGAQRRLPVFTPRDQIATFACPSCGKAFPRPKSDAGKRARCPHCQKIVRLEEVKHARGRAKA